MTAPKRTWLVVHTEHEGFPIHFRRPEIGVVEFEALRPTYPRLLIIELVLTDVRENGLPQQEYNQSLYSLDMSLSAPFDNENEGLIALIETFAGKRTYYIYLAQSFDAEAYMREAEARFPHEDLTHEVSDDSPWRVFNGYARDFGFAFPNVARTI